MRLSEITFKNLRRRKARMLFLVLGLLVGIGTVVSLVSLTTALNADLRERMEQNGANLVIFPKSDLLTLSYGGIQIASELVGVAELRDEDLAKIRLITERGNIKLISPKILGTDRIQNTDIVIAGVDFGTEIKMKKWWTIDGNRPVTPQDVIVGSTLSSELGLKLGTKFILKGQRFQVTGILAENGTQEDNTVFMELYKAQDLLGRSNSLSLIEIMAQSKDNL